MSKHDNDLSEFERVAHAGSMVTLRYALLQIVQPSQRASKWPWVIGPAAIAATGFMHKLGWF